MTFGLGGILFAGFSSWFVRRFGEMGLIVRGGLVAGAALLWVAAGGGWMGAIVACTMLGCGFYMLHNTLQTNATQMSPERRGAAVSAFASLFFLGQASGVAAAGLAVERCGTGVAIATGGLGVVAVALAFAWAKRRHEYH